MSEATPDYATDNVTMTVVAFDEQFFINWRAALLAQVDEIERVLIEQGKNMVRTKELRKRCRNQGRNG